MNGILNFIVSVATTPALLVGLIAMLGLILQKKAATAVIQGSIKTFAGFLVLTGGAGILVTSLNPFATMFQHVFNAKGVVPSNEAVVALALVKYGTPAALIMIVGFIVNVILARFTRFKYIFLTGQAMLYVSTMSAVVLISAGLGNGWLTILLGGIFEGTLLTITPALTQRYMRKITGNDGVGMGHTGNMGYALSGYLGEKLGNKDPEKSTEKLNIPKNLGFLRDSTVSISLVMMVVYVGLALIAGPRFVESSSLSAGTNYIVYAITQAGTFAAGFVVVLQGVRMILSEIIPAFQGIAKKLVPNSKPALDVPIVFPYAPNAVLIGFFCLLYCWSYFYANNAWLRNNANYSWGCWYFLLWRSSWCLWQCFWWSTWGDYRLTCKWITISLGSTINSACFRFIWGRRVFDLC